jgi:hypothetical protein
MVWVPKLSASWAHCDQPAALDRRHRILRDRVLDGRLSIGRVVDNADELRGHVLDEDSPGIGLADLSCRGHCGVGPTVCGVTVPDSDQMSDVKGPPSGPGGPREATMIGS